MNWLTKAMAPIRQLMVHSPRANFTSTLLRRTAFDYRREVGDCLDASVVTAPIQFLQRSLPEARLAVRRRQRGGTVVELPDHPLLQLVANPNPFYGDIALLAGTILSYVIDGNAYWLKVRNGAGQVVELWYVPHWMIEPKAPIDGGAFLSHYEYRPGGVAPILYRPDDVVHFRHGIDPHNMCKGLSPLNGVIREIFMDLESSNFVASLLRNMGVPGVVISPKGGAMPSPEDVAATRTWFASAFSGDRRGAPLVMGAPTDISQFGFNPGQMNMGESRNIAEERVCASIGVPAAVVGFGAGLEQTQVGATMTELRKLAWHNGVLPLGRALVDEMRRSLLPDFSDTGGMAALDLYWNTDDVPALQEEEDKQADRWNKALDAGGVTLFEWRQARGLPADDSHKFYLRKIAVMEVPEGTPPVAPQLPAPKSFGAKAVASDAAYQRGVAFATLLERQQSGQSDVFERSLTGVFAPWRAAALAAALAVLPHHPEITAPKAAKAEETAFEALVREILDLLDTDLWREALTQAYRAHYLEIAAAVADAAERIGLGTGLPDAVARAIVATGGRRVGLIDLDAQTRQSVFDALAEGRAEGEGVQALANRIADKVEAGPWSEAKLRARIIARTETKYAQNISTIIRGRDAGVTSFIIFDGRFGLPRSTQSHIDRDGTIVTADEAIALADAEHPNGTLSFAPNFEE